MCGISGIYRYHKDSLVSRELLEKMNKALEHRGPDDEGYYVNHNIGFGHRRLSIIDVEGGHQPMANEDNTVWIVQNGEIYNYLELRRDLSLGGHVFKTHSDTEVIIHLYEQYGEKCVDMLNGMFSFAIWDDRKKQLFLARDRFGIKPLYYYSDAHGLIFASEIKAILQDEKISASLNQSGLHDYVAFQFCLGDETLFKGIKKLLPGHTLLVKDKHLKITKYWDLEFDIDEGREESYYSEKLMMLIEDSVRFQLRSDVSIGAYLSGGIDSSTIVCHASSLLGTPLKTFTGYFKEGMEFDERRYASEIAKFCKSVHHEVCITSDDFIKSFDKLIYFLDEPVAGPGVLPQYVVSKVASKNVKVVLGGQGGDETFGGYIRYFLAYFEDSIGKIIFADHQSSAPSPDLETMLGNLSQLKGYRPLMRYFWQDGLFDEQDKRYHRLIRKDVTINQLLSDEALQAKNLDKTFERFQSVFNQVEKETLINKMMHFDVKTLLPALLQVEDRASMSASLESRVPLLDHRIIKLACSIPPRIKFKGGATKHIFKLAATNIVPKKILSRQDKMGFPVPLSQWYKGPLHDYVKDILISDTTRKRGLFNVKKIEHYLDNEVKYGRTIWGLLCLETWFRTFID